MKLEEVLELSRKTGQMRKVCGNCRYHNTYKYPDQVFCFARFSHRENPVVSVWFDHCNEWESKLQECFCLEDSLKKRGKRTK